MLRVQVQKSTAVILKKMTFHTVFRVSGIKTEQIELPFLEQISYSSVWEVPRDIDEETVS